MCQPTGDGVKTSKEHIQNITEPVFVIYMIDMDIHEGETEVCLENSETQYMWSYSNKS